MTIRDYYDYNGIKRRVLVPDDDAPPEEGVPLSLPVDELYSEMPLPFKQKLAEALFARGLIEPRDFFKAGAAELARAAILDVAKYDALDMITLAHKHSQQ